jgi:hypothetical protein
LMRKLVSALGAASAAVAVSGGTATADDDGPNPDDSAQYVSPAGTATTLEGTPPRGYGLGGAHVPGIPYDEYIRMTGEQWFPGLQRQKVDYWAGQIQGRTLERLFPGIDQAFPGLGLDGPSIGASVEQGAGNVIETVNRDGPGTVLGLSEGAMVVNAVQARLAADPNAPPPDQLTFAVFGDPIGQHAFGDGWLRRNFPVGAMVPSMEFVIPPPVESQYDTYSFVSPYDSISRQCDRRPSHRTHRRSVYQPEQRSGPQHPHDGQFARRQDDHVHDPPRAPTPGHAVEVPGLRPGHAEPT